MNVYSRLGGLPVLTLLLCILCSVTVAPVMARERTDSVEDGVHLVKIEGYPTQIDRIHYSIYPTQTIVVDGTHDYWIQIGKDKVNELIHVWWAPYVGVVLSVIITTIVIMSCAYLFKRFGPAWINQPFARTTDGMFTTNGMFVLFFLGMSLMSHLTPIIENRVNLYACQEVIQRQDADGCILLKVNKMSVESDPLLLKSGLDFTPLQHIDGTVPSGGIL